MNLLDAYNKYTTQQQQLPGTVQYQQANPIQQPKTTLEMAYNKALGKTTPNWAIQLSNVMPSIAEIIAGNTTKGEFNQGKIADSLERQKDRQIAYNQALQNIEDNQVKDYVAMAREQLGLDMAEDDKNYNRELTANQIAYKKAMDLLEQQNKDRQFELAKEQADIENKNKADMLELQKSKINAEIDALKNKPAELTPEQKLQQKIEEENAIAKAKAKREAQQDLSRAISGQKAFEGNIAHLKDLSKNTGTILDRSIGGIASLFSGKDNSLTKANNSMSELVAQLRQAALNASGISGESDDKAQQAKINDIYKRVGLTDKTKSLTQAEVNGIINNIQNLYKQRVAEKQNLLDSFIDNNSITWE